jgi:hypothetical protein
MSRLDELKSVWARCAPDEKWQAASDLLLDLLGGIPDRVVPIRIPDGPTWSYLCPAGLFRDLTTPTERVEELFARELEPALGPHLDAPL